jgi:ribosomal protein S18 acetylase RimI-like enzyme
MSSQGKPLVTVIVPTYGNRAHRLQCALGSIYAQEGAGEIFDMEVVVVDNASSGPTGEVIQRFPGTRYVRFEDNRGPAVARNAGIRDARGKYIAFLDDDDLWLPHKLRFQVPALESDAEVRVAYGQIVQVYKDSTAIWPRADEGPRGWIFWGLLLGNVVHIATVLVPRQAFETAGYFDETLAALSDDNLWVRFAFHFPFTFVPSPVALYLRSPEGVFSTGFASGAVERSTQATLERAFAMVTGTDDDVEALRQQAFARAALRLADGLEDAGEVERATSQLSKALQEFPWVAGDEWARPRIQRLMRKIALGSGSAMATTQTFCAEVLTGVQRVPRSQQRAVRRLVGDIWADVAVHLAKNQSPSDAVRAAVKALFYNPSTRKRKRPLRMIAKAVLGIGTPLGRSRIRHAEGGPPRVRLARPQDAPALARLHIHSLPEGFLSSLGERFLRVFYAALATDKGAITLVADGDEGVVGFAAGVTSVGDFYRRFFARRAIPAAIAAAHHLWHPRMLSRAWETARYARDTGDYPEAELISIGIADSRRGRGLGRQLLEGVLEGLREKGVQEVRVMVGADNDPANEFYSRMGFRALGRIPVHRGQLSNLWVTSCRSSQHSSSA